MNERPESKRSCIICEKATASPRLKRLFTLRLRRGNWWMHLFASRRVDAFICFQKNGWENFSVNVLVSILGIAPSLGYDCLVFARRLHPVVQTTG